MNNNQTEPQVDVELEVIRASEVTPKSNGSGIRIFLLAK